MSTRPEAKDAIKWYNDAKSIRSPLEADMRMAAAYCMPRQYGSWQTDGPPGSYGSNQAARRFAYDNTGARSVPKYVAILNRLATPEGQRWHKVEASNPQLMKSYSVRQYFDSVNDILFKYRKAPRARFTQASGEVYAGMGVYGMGPVSLTWRNPSHQDRRGGFKYKAWPMRDIYVLVDDEGEVVVIFRRFWLNGRQYKEKFGDENAPRCVRTEIDKPGGPTETNFFEFVQLLHHRKDYEPNGALDLRQYPICGSYLCVKDQEYVGEEEGFTSMPMLTPRPFTEAGDAYGYSPAIQALPALGGVSQMKKTVLKQGHKAVDPPVLAADDGALSGRVDQRPGHVTFGGVNAQGQPLVHVMESKSNFQVAEKLVEDERRDIEDSFFVTLFQWLNESPEMTATEVIEKLADRAALLAPTMGRLQAEWLGPCIEREITLLAEHRLLPDMPPELMEARGEYNVIYTSPLAKGQYAEEIAGFFRVTEMALKATEATQDPSKMDYLNFDTAIPEIADMLAVRTSWVHDDEAVKAKREQRAEQQQQSELLKQAPAGASIVNSMMKQGSQVQGVSN